MNIFTVFLLLMVAIHKAKADQRLLCASWSSIERELIHDAQQVNCTISSNCSGIVCSIHQYGYDVNGGIAIDSCEHPPSVNLNIDVPKLNIKKWHRKFAHGDKFSLSETLGGVIEINQENDKYILGLSLDVPSGIKPDSPLLHLMPSLASSTKVQLFQNVIVYVPHCIALNNTTVSIPISDISSTVLPTLVSAGNAQGNCSILNSSCTINETCQQIDSRSLEGFCICSTDYYRNKEGKCIYMPPLITTTESPGGNSPHKKKTSLKSVLLTAILVPIIVIALAVWIVYATIRFRVVNLLRRRLRVQVYENVLLGQDDDDEESLNPVV